MTSRRAPRARHALAVGLSLTVVALCGAASLRLASCTPAPSSERRPTAGGELPGISPRPPALREKLAGALAAKGPSYKPRTGHLLPGGAPKYVNRLILEASPYLLQHAHNPVDWFPWGDEAFEAARREGKPVFLSVGYSTCHWCHVMERESFEDEEIAAYINQHFIAIKVDREERPDVDALYMNAVFALAGSGGWPMTILMTDDRRPFFAGTYFPARDGDRGMKRGLQSILKELAERYASDRAALVERASELSQRIQRGLEVAASGGGEVPDPAIIMEVVAQLNRSFDEKNGGFGGAPKFPRSTEIELLLRHHKKTGDARALEMAQKTLDAMAAGGIWDHLVGGFHRYATDARWRIPHFEKMLYDNAQLAATYTEAFQATGAPRYATIARRTLDYVLREMTSPEGGFYAATDADSEGHEGAFFVWTPAEITAVVGAERAPAILRYFGVTQEGNFEGKSVLFTPRPAADVAREFSMTEASFLDEIERSRALLYEARQKRVRPLRDDKILAAWNGLMISAMARGGFGLAEPRYIEAARRAADLLLTRRAEGGRLARNVAAPVKSPGFLDDHAFFIAGLLDLHHATAETRWLDEALSLQAQLETHFWDAAAGGFFLAASDGERLFARDKPDHDGAEPSGNSVAVLNLCRMAELTSSHRYREVANKTLTAFASPLRRSPRALPKMLAALDFCASSPLEIAIVSPPSGATADAMLAVLRASFVPNHVLVVATEGADLTQKAARIPLLEEKVARNGLPTAYVCRAGTCKQPTTDVGALSRQLAETR